MKIFVKENSFLLVLSDI